MSTLFSGVLVSDNPGDEVQSVPEVHSVRLGDLPSPSEHLGDGPDDAASPDSIEELRQRYRALCRKSLFFLCKAVLGFHDITMRTHWDYCMFIQDLEVKRTLDLMPRGTFKTSIGTHGFSIWLLINNPNYRILISNQTMDNAERFVEEIEAHLDGSNPLMVWLFPEMIRPNLRYKPWSSSKFTVPNRTLVSGTASVTALGVGSKAESKHHDVHIKDDLIGRKHMVSPLEMIEAISWDDYSEALLIDPGNDIERMHGTRWSLSDLYEEKQKDARYKIFLRTAILEDGSLFFPERLTHETLRAIRDRNFLTFMSQYQNDPSSPESLDFRKEHLRYYLMGLDRTRDEYYCEIDGRKFWVKDMSVGILVDPASSGDLDLDIAKAMKRGRAHKANNAIMVLGAHPSGRWFILDMWAGRGQGENPELQIAKKMYDFAQRWNGYARKGYVEAFGAEGGLITVFNMLCKQKGYYFPFEKIPRGKVRSKTVRIRGNIGSIAGQGLLCVRSIHDQFIMEYSQFPQSNTFDTLDCLAWGIEVIPPPRYEAEDAVSREKSKRHKHLRMKIGRAGY